MKTDLFTYPRFISLFLRLKLLNLTSRFPPLPGVFPGRGRAAYGSLVFLILLPTCFWKGFLV
jgi:hypothetical protein